MKNKEKKYDELDIAIDAAIDASLPGEYDKVDAAIDAAIETAHESGGFTECSDYWEESPKNHRGYWEESPRNHRG